MDYLFVLRNVRGWMGVTKCATVHYLGERGRVQNNKKLRIAPILKPMVDTKNNILKQVFLNLKISLRTLNRHILPKMTCMYKDC